MAENEQKSNVELISNDTFDRLRASKNRRKILNAFLYFTVAICICGAFVIVCILVFFKIDEIEVTGSIMYSADLIVGTSGIEPEQNIYSLNERQIEQAIIMNHPYIKGVEIKRHLPSAVELFLIEDTPCYYTLFIDEYFVLSNNLRVLERTEDLVRIMELKITYGLVEIKIPAITYSVVGREIVFKRSSDFDFVKNIMESFESTGLYADINKVNLSNKYNIYVIYNNRYKIMFGNSNDLYSKITYALGILDDNWEEMRKYQKGIIEVYDVNIASFEGNNQLILE